MGKNSNEVNTNPQTEEVVVVVAEEKPQTVGVRTLVLSSAYGSQNPPDHL
ncbi:MAG: hypothetical protein WCO35_00090 [Candidatus Nomurabacteria bacterium]